MPSENFPSSYPLASKRTQDYDTLPQRRQNLITFLSRTRDPYVLLIRSFVRSPIMMLQLVIMMLAASVLSSGLPFTFSELRPPTQSYTQGSLSCLEAFYPTRAFRTLHGQDCQGLFPLR